MYFIKSIIMRKLFTREEKMLIKFLNKYSNKGEENDKHKIYNNRRRKISKRFN